MADDASPPLIRVEGLYKVFGERPASVLARIEQGQSKEQILEETGHTVGLVDINLDIQPGEIFVIMGLSGSGKSTLIRHFNRLIDPTGGRILVGDTDVLALAQPDLEAFRRARMSMVFQHFGLMPHKTVLENVAYGLMVQGVAKEQRSAKALEWLETVGLRGYERQYPAQLSGGQQQRVGLARALCADTDILLMDEAFSALDPLIRSEMQDQLIELQSQLKKTILFITHDLDEALRLGDRIAILKDGRLSQVGKPEEILLHPADDYVEAFVRDVNRARVLTADVVMQPPACRLTTENLTDALKQMRGSHDEFGYVFNDDTYRGIVSRDAIEGALKKPGHEADNVVTLAESVPTVRPEASLEEVLPASLGHAYPVPVVCDEGQLRGVVSRRRMISILSESDEPDKPAGPGVGKPSAA